MRTGIQKAIPASSQRLEGCLFPVAVVTATSGFSYVKEIELAFQESMAVVDDIVSGQFRTFQVADWLVILLIADGNTMCIVGS